MDTSSRATAPATPSPTPITPAELRASLGRAGTPLVLDVRRRARFDASDVLLPSAVYCTPEDIAALTASQAPGRVVAYCVYGHEVSQGAAAQLAAAGWDASFLVGGIEGGEPGADDPALIEQCRGALLRIRKRPDLGVTGEAPSRWITRERPKIDRIACPWLIRRFIDARAQFHYVPTSQVLAQAQALGAIAYDLPGAPITHEGEACSFDALLAAFSIDDPALSRLAAIVRGADTARLDLAPQAAGLLAFSLGLSRLHEDDHAMLEAAMPLYDALYAWCRAPDAESHQWNPAVMKAAA